MGVTSKEQAADDRWIPGSIHRWDGHKVRLGFTTTLEQADPDDWWIKVNWRLVDGRAVPVGLEVHSSRTAHHKGDSWPDGDRPKAITRDLFKRLPVGELIDKGGEQVAAVWDAITARTPGPEAQRVADALAATSAPSSPSDWKYRRTAEVYAAVVVDPRTPKGKVAISTWRRLSDDGDPALHTTPEQVRKWIAKARERGYLPPADHGKRPRGLSPRVRVARPPAPPGEEGTRSENSGSRSVWSATPDTVKVCMSCGRESRSPNPRGWSAVLTKSQTVGHTCGDCPRAGTTGEPIRRLVRGGRVTFRVTLDRAPDPATGKRRQVARVFNSLAQAREALPTFRAQIAAEDDRERNHGAVTVSPDMTVNELSDGWLEYRRGEVREVTRETYVNALKPVRRQLGARKVRTLTHGDVVGLRRWLSESGGVNGRPLGSHASRAALTTFKATLGYAVNVLRILPEDPARGVKVKAMQAGGDGRSRTELERWTPSELVKFTAHADTDPHAAAWRLATLGLRREESLGLAWDAVDFDAGTITVRQTRVAVSSSADPRRWMMGPVKAAASERTIRPDAVQPGTMKALRQLKVASVVNPLENPGELVVVDPLGAPVNPRTFTERFQALARAAGVPVIRLHSTRHTAAYLLHDAAVPPVKAAAFLGHTLAVHLSVYLFAREEDVDLAGTALGQVLARAQRSRNRCASAHSVTRV